MRLNSYFAQKTNHPSTSPAAPFMVNCLVVGPFGQGPVGLWADMYRLAYQRSREALAPTAYDRAMAATDN